MGMGNISITGMQAAMSNMEVISNNIANANTNGFKRSSANFADIFPAGGSSGAQIGLGVSLSSVQQNFSAGGPVQTGIGSNLMLGGSGFFIVKDPVTGASGYTRDGSFTFNSNNGYFTTSSGQRLQGFIANNGVIPAGSSVTDLYINTGSIPAKATSAITQSGVNCSSNDSVPATSPFSTSDSTSYNFNSTSTVYDSLGNSNTLTLYYIKTASNNWTVNAYIGGSSAGTGSLSFNTDGTLNSATGFSSFSFSPTSGATSPQTFSVDMTGVTQMGLSDKSGIFTPDGYPAGTYTGYSIDSSGNVTVSYSNNKQVIAGQVAVAQFQSPEGLQYTGNGEWNSTTASGQPSILPSNSVGITSGAIESSNVDLATELVNLIGAQNTFQANAQVEQTYNQVMQTVTKL